MTAKDNLYKAIAEGPAILRSYILYLEENSTHASLTNRRHWAEKVEPVFTTED